MKKIFIPFIALTLIACNIDRSPFDSKESDAILADPTGLQTITLGNYALLKGDADGGGFFNNLYRVGEYGGDNIDISGTTSDEFFYYYNYRSIKNNGRSNTIWNAGYKAIIGCNKVITKFSEGKDAETDQLIGENYFLRAYVYFSLVNVFGRPYNQGTGNLGVPLKISDDVNELPARATVGAIYDQVISDLKKAEQLFKKTKVEKLPIIDKQGKLKGLFTYSDILKLKSHPNAVKDSFGRLLVGAGVCITRDMLDRVAALQNVGVDIIGLDSAHGHSKGVINALKEVKKNFKKKGVHTHGSIHSNHQ